MLQSWHVLRLSVIVPIALAALGAAGTTSAEVARHPCVPKSAEIRFKAADGTRLAGYRLGKGRTAVVLAHQSRGDACQWAGYAKRPARLGYLVIAIDFRGYGDSQTRGGRAAGRLAADVAAGAKAARARGARKVHCGSSMAARPLVAGANIRPPLSGVISLSGLRRLHRAGRAEVGSSPHSADLYVVGQFDSDFVPDAQRLYDATASHDKAVQVLPVGHHGVDLVRSDARARALVEGFLRSH